jgi:hypothetical protein
MVNIFIIIINSQSLANDNEFSLTVQEYKSNVEQKEI